MKTLELPNDYPRIIRMASGHLSLELSDQLSFDEFPEYAKEFLATLGGCIEEKNDSIIMCIWDAVINENKYRLVYDDYPRGVSLESQGLDGDNELLKIKEIILV